MEKGTENTRVTLIGIIVEDPEAAIRINGLLHEYGEYIIGRMGIPYHEKQMNIISVVIRLIYDFYNIPILHVTRRSHFPTL